MCATRRNESANRKSWNSNTNSRRMRNVGVPPLGARSQPPTGGQIKATSFGRGCLLYLASVPIVVATGLWVWTEKMVSRDYDETAGYDSLVISFGSRFSGRVIVPMLSAFLAVTLVLAVWSKSIMPYALATLFSFGFVWRIVTVAREGYSNESRMQLAHRSAFVVHLMICIVIAASSFFTFFR